MQPMACPNCHAPAWSGRFCTTCGAALPPAPSLPYQQREPGKPGLSTNSKLVLGCLGLAGFAFVLFIGFIVALQSDSPKPNPSTKTRSESAGSVANGAAPSPDIGKELTSDPLFAVPAGMIPLYRILDGKPVQEGHARYLRARIVVPAGLDRAVLEANIRHAAKTLYDRDHPTGMFVFAYKQGTDINGFYTAGRCDFHPISKDKHDPTITLSDCEAKIDLKDNYFQVAVPPAPKGTDDAAWRAVHEKVGEDQRRRIYYEIGSTGDSAAKEAERKYPDILGHGRQAFVDQAGKRNQLEEDLTKRYENAIAKKHRLPYAEVEAIKTEGFLGNWPLPAMK